jgi:hypothetical protein
LLSMSVQNKHSFRDIREAFSSEARPAAAGYALYVSAAWHTKQLWDRSRSCIGDD